MRVLFTVEVGSQTDFSITKLVEKRREGQNKAREPCKNYENGYIGYLDCVQQKIRRDYFEVLVKGFKLVTLKSIMAVFDFNENEVFQLR